MIIQNNMLAQNAVRQLKTVDNYKQKSTKKLSSGYRVNIAADDAAVLTISEKMRAQIKGLTQGSGNTSEGISAIQVAEGAMGEITEIIQRMRELTVKSYNGSMTQNDRLACQFEVDSLLEEMERITESTEFNTASLLQGGPVSQKLVKAGEVSTVKMPIVSENELPAWVTGDNKTIYNNSRVDSSNKQDLTEVMIKNEGAPTEEIWGGSASDPSKKWTETLTDNATAVLDFSALAALNDKDAIMAHLSSLVATGVGYPCATCSGIKNGFYFVTDEMGEVQVIDNDISEYGRISLDSLMKKVSESTAATPAELKTLAEDVAKELVNSVLNSTKDFKHFDNFIKLTNNAGTETYSIAVYDFRDKRATDPISAENDVDRTLAIKFSVPMKMTTSDFYESVHDPLIIQAGDSNREADTIDIHLPDTSLANLNLRNYSVFKDRGYSSLTPPDYYLEEDYKNLYEMDKKTGKYVLRKGKLDPIGVPYTHTITIDEGHMEQKYIPGIPDTTNSVGEIVKGRPPRIASIFVKTGERVETKTYTQYNRLGDEPALVYEPSDISLLDDALSSVLRGRGRLGAHQNRLEYAKKINDNTSENLQSAESKMRDTDIATEIVNKSKSDILSQVAESMLAQANQSPQRVLSLLQV